MSTYIGNNEISSIYVGNSKISNIYVGTDLVYSSGVDYLCFTSQQDGSTVALSKVGTPTTITLEYSLDKETWNTWDLSAVTLNSGDTMYLRGDNNGFSTSTSSRYTFVMSGAIAAAGSIMTLLDSTNTLRTVSNYMFSRIFFECSGLTDASKLKLPAITLATMCYESFFRKCQNLTKAPIKLPATTLAQSCYQGMFELTQIATAPELPAKTLKTYCYNSMFKSCTSLTTAPELPATTLANNCYNDMFSGCTSLVSAPELPATTLAQSCYLNMFASCTGLTVAPELHATTLVQSCYQGMFNGCTSLNTVTSYANNISASGCLTNWLNNVAASGTFYNCGNATYPSGASGIPSGWFESKGYKWTPTALGLFSTHNGVTYSGSTWTFGTDSDGDYYYNNGSNEMIPLGYEIDGTERFRIKFKYENADGRQLLGNEAQYNDDRYTYRFFLYNGLSFDVGENTGGMSRISTVGDIQGLADLEISNHYIKYYNGSMIVEDSNPPTYVPPQNNMLYVGTDGSSQIKIYGIEILQ